MFNTESFEDRLSGGKSNSLGEVPNIVDEVVDDKYLLEDLFQCFFSNNSLVRLRTSHAMKQIAERKPRIIRKYYNRLINNVSKIKQDSVQAVLADTFLVLDSELNREQKKRAIKALKANLGRAKRPEAINSIVDTLMAWSDQDEELAEWTKSKLKKRTESKNKKVASTAEAKLEEIS